MKKSIAALALAGTILFAGTAPAMADSYPAPGNEWGTVSDGTINRGASVTFSGSGYVPGETVNITFEKTGGPKGSAPAALSVTAGSSGAFSTNITFPNAGNYMITAVGATSGNTRSARVSVNNGNHNGENNGNNNPGNGNGKGKGNSNLVSVSSITDAGAATSQANSAADSNIILWGLTGAGVLAACTVSVAVIRRRSKS
ncbi:MULTISPECIES: hypothetical protein [Arthrobacter]|uniref:Uncharacterized protein n=1 Tax=Arthrobacter terricola TaxID=2547396 RepID=A0A4V2ZTI9_9MICC|nr:MULTISPECIES: hypothetical protein [Arthrobacter]MBT8160958.1 hypothetical protein [Arthrobacter sp. GN70]TDF97294.1 hypothetical protein E1809_07985 [Arthrobacter terricola]